MTRGQIVGMTRAARIEAVACVIFRFRGCPGLLPGDEISRDTVQREDVEEAERFIDMIDAAAGIVGRTR